MSYLERMQETKYIHVKVKTQAKKDSVIEKNGTYRIEVKEKARQGKANERVKDLLAETLLIERKRLRLIKGGSTPSKLFLIIK